MTVLLFTLAGGAILMAIAWVTPTGWLVNPAADVLAAAAVIAFYIATALMLEGMLSRPIGQAISVGDIFTYSGVVVVIVGGMRRRTKAQRAATPEVQGV